jgi:beta-fructofuranosidase
MLGDWDQIMSVPQRLTLGEDERLRIEPVASMASLRGAPTTVTETVIPVGRDLLLDVEGDVLELELEIDPQSCRHVELSVLRSADGEERTAISFFNQRRGDGSRVDDEQQDEAIVLDATRSSLSDAVTARPPETALVDRGGENLRLRVFIDRSVVEVFVNGRQYLAGRAYPTREDSVGVSLRSFGGEATLAGLSAWQLTPIWPTESRRIEP